MCTLMDNKCFLLFQRFTTYFTDELPFLVHLHMGDLGVDVAQALATDWTVKLATVHVL